MDDHQQPPALYSPGRCSRACRLPGRDPQGVVIPGQVRIFLLSLGLLFGLFCSGPEGSDDARSNPCPQLLSVPVHPAGRRGEVVGWGGDSTWVQGAGQAARGVVRGQTCPKRPWHKTCPQLAARRGREGVTAHSGTKALTLFERAEVPPSPGDSLVLWP